MRTRLLIFLLTAIYGAAKAQPQQKALENLLIDNNLPGLQLAYTEKGKTTFYNAGVGKAGISDKITPATVFRAGSLGKCVFAYAVLRLCDSGLLSLDTPLMRYIGTYTRFDLKDPRYSMITARMVLSHTSGLAEFPQFETGEPVKLLFAPGSSYSYSGEGYWFLQKVMEKITGKPFEQLMQEEVFKPLGMQRSTYVQNKEMDTAIIGIESQDLASMLPNAAFSLLTNAHDYNLFLRALLAGRGLKPATQRMMFSRQVKNPIAMNDTAKYVNWGLGVGLARGAKQNLIWHWGKTGDFISLFVANPASGQSFVFFTRGAALKAGDQLISMFLGRQTALTMRPLHFCYDEPETMPRLFAALRQKGFDKATAVFAALKAKGLNFSEGDLNWYGTGLLKQKHSHQALAIFKQAVSLYPKSPVAIANYAAAAEATGDPALAIKSYKQSLRLDPANESARNHITALENAVHFGNAGLTVFEGKYKREDKPTIFVSFEAKDGKLILTQSWDGGRLEFFRTGELDFYNEEPGFSLKFEKGGDGRMTKYFMNGIKMGWVRE